MVAVEDTKKESKKRTDELITYIYIYIIDSFGDV